MSLVVSARDVLKALNQLGHTQFKNEVDLLPISADSIVYPVLYEFGIDTEYPVDITVNNHRDLFKKVGIGYRFVGESRIDAGWRKSPLFGVTERLIVSSYTDHSLTKELCSLMGTSDNISGYSEEEGANDALTADQLEPDSEYKDTLKTIKNMQDLVTHIRGTKYNEAGDLKTQQEYAEELTKVGK